MEVVQFPWLPLVGPLVLDVRLGLVPGEGGLERGDPTFATVRAAHALVLLVLAGVAPLTHGRSPNELQPGLQPPFP